MVYIFCYRCTLIPENDNCTGILSDKYYVPDASYVDNSILNFVQHSDIVELIANHEGCILFFNVILCFFKYPPCDVNTSELLPLYTERCSELHELLEPCELIKFINTDFNYSSVTTFFSALPPNLKVSTTSCSKF